MLMDCNCSIWVSGYEGRRFGRPRTLKKWVRCVRGRVKELMPHALVCENLTPRKLLRMFLRYALTKRGGLSTTMIRELRAGARRWDPGFLPTLRRLYRGDGNLWHLNWWAQFWRTPPHLVWRECRKIHFTQLIHTDFVERGPQGAGQRSEVIILAARLALTHQDRPLPAWEDAQALMVISDVMNS